MNWKALLHSIIAAIAGGALSGVAAYAASGGAVNAKTLEGAAIGGALTGIGALLKQSPLEK